MLGAICKNIAIASVELKAAMNVGKAIEVKVHFITTARRDAMCS